MMGARMLLRLDKAVRVEGQFVIVRLADSAYGIKADFNDNETARLGASRLIKLWLQSARTNEEYNARAHAWFELIKYIEEESIAAES